MPDENLALPSRRAIEALRNGVPNRDAVTLLGCNQPAAEQRFSELLDGVDTASDVQGMLVSGDFGSGKSHLLAHLENQALSKQFVCSKVTISKETPLYDLEKVFKSALENGRMPDRRGRLIEELGQVLKPDSDSYVQFSQWADGATDINLLSGMFPASLMVHERSKDIELNSKIEYWWAGERLKVSDVKDGLKMIGQSKNFPFHAPKARDLPPQRLRFATELIKGAGYKGWVVLLDEIELVGSYSVLQRGRSYAELCKWLGQATNGDYPGLIVVGTVTEDFAAEVIGPDGRKKDWELLPKKLSASRYKDITPHAQTGMRLLERSCVPLNPPSEEDVRSTVGKLQSIYSHAYKWEAPPSEIKAGGAAHLGRMRYKVRTAINEWDLLRLVPDSHPETESAGFKYGYEEDPALEQTSKDDSDDGG